MEEYYYKWLNLLDAAKKIDGSIVSMPRTFKPLEHSEEMEDYWHRFNELKKRNGLAINQDDNEETMFCKAYITGNGRESRTFEVMREHGIKVWAQDYRYSSVFMPTIFPRNEEEQQRAMQAVQDKELLFFAQSIGRMRNKKYY